jgi:hypothetical protein
VFLGLSNTMTRGNTSNAYAIIEAIKIVGIYEKSNRETHYHSKQPRFFRQA